MVAIEAGGEQGRGVTTADFVVLLADHGGQRKEGR